MPIKVNTDSAAEFICDIAKVLRGEHQSYRGDRVYNTEFICFQLGRQHADKGREFIDDILTNLQEASDISGLHPDRCEQIANMIRGGVSYYVNHEQKGAA